MSTNRHEATIDAFFALIKAGLWEQAGVNLNAKVDWDEVYQLAEEQSVIGVVLAGIEHSRVKPPQELLLQWIGEVQMLEQKNKEMNSFVAELIEKLRTADIYTLLVKGQGIAQCYERPLWRACGDVDLFLSDDNYQKAKRYLLPIAELLEPEGLYKKHFEMLIDPWVVELHGSMRSGLSSRMDRVIDETQKEVFYGGNVQSWLNGKTQVFLPGVNCDVIFVFTHFIKHFYCEGLGLRQICDWCRLLWTYRSELDSRLLEIRIKKMGLMNVWKGFAAFAVDYLGMPEKAMPFYSTDKKWKRKANKICSFILAVGNFGHNRDSSYYENENRFVRKLYSFGRRCGDMLHHAKIFPFETLRFFPNMVYNGLRAVVRGE